jgi:hypothetical protein
MMNMPVRRKNGADQCAPRPGKYPSPWPRPPASPSKAASQASGFLLLLHGSQQEEHRLQPFARHGKKAMPISA